MKIPGFTADASLLRTGKTYRMSGQNPRRGRLSLVLPQLGFSVGVTYPPTDDDCYYCVRWVRGPCGLSRWI
jgi:hypothetical protein